MESVGTGLFDEFIPILVTLTNTIHTLYDTRVGGGGGGGLPLAYRSRRCSRDWTPAPDPVIREGGVEIYLGNLRNNPRSSWTDG